jgi:RecA-family ATPase
VKAKLVILDPLQAFLGAIVDMHRANEVRPLLTLIGKMAEAQHCAVVAVRHWNKSAGGKAVYRGLGSIDFTAHARSVLVIGESPDDESIRILAQSKSALTIKGRSQMFRLTDQKFEWCGSCDVDADTLASIQPNKRRIQRGNAMEWLKDYLRDEPQPALAVIVAAEAVGISKGTLQRAKAALGILSSKEGKDGQWYWRLPDFKPWDRRGPEDDENDPPF